MKNIYRNICFRAILAIAAGTLAELLWFRDWEVSALGAIAALFALPAVCVYSIGSEAGLRNILFWVLLLPLPMYGVSMTAFPSEAARQEGAGGLHGWGMAIAVPTIAAGIAPYLFDILRRRLSSEPHST